MFTINKVRNIIHRTRTVKGIHRNQVLKRRRLQLTQVLLHTGRLKLESTDRSSVTVKFISSRILDWNGIDIQFHSFTQTNIFDSLLYNRQCFQPQKVHLDQSGIFDHRTFILGNQHLFAGLFIISRADRYPIRDIITTNNSATGMYTRSTHIPLKHLGIFHRIPHQRIGRCFSRLQFGHIFYGILQIQFLIRNFIRNQFGQAIRFGKRKFLNTGNIFDSQFRSHSTIGNDMRHLFLSIFLRHPT